MPTVPHSPARANPGRPPTFPAARPPADNAPLPQLLAAARGSPAARELALLAALYRTAHALAEAYLADHPDGCPCPWCGYERHPASFSFTRDDVAGPLWALEVAAGMLCSALPDKVNLDGDTFGDDLRTLAALADALDAEPDPAGEADPDIDAPVVVGGR